MARRMGQPGLVLRQALQRRLHGIRGCSLQGHNEKNDASNKGESADNIDLLQNGGEQGMQSIQ